VLIVLVPARCIASWTQSNSHLRGRATLQILAAALLFLFFIPEVAFALRPGSGWLPLLQTPSWERQLGAQLLLLLAIPGIGAVMEFVERGSGTPIPHDPPVRLVTSGIYRYCANPMQLSATCVLLVWAGMLRNGWVLLASLISIAYSAGLAEWDEGADLNRRFGDPWRQYRRAVRNWRPRWKPYHAGPSATIYIAETCGPCSQLRTWIEARRPTGLQIIAAETLAAGSIRRMRYEPEDGTKPVDGVRAMGRVLEHLNLGWAIAGTALRIPGVWQSAQLLMDASGLGPRALRHTDSSQAVQSEK
jgi:protein-S-isoprenylcysteine O-methyltransferase Ste14